VVGHPDLQYGTFALANRGSGLNTTQPGFPGALAILDLQDSVFALANRGSSLNSTQPGFPGVLVVWISSTTCSFRQTGLWP